MATLMPADMLAACHEEVVAALREIGNPALGESIRRDRGSELEHMGIRFPALRARVKQGFSFYSLSDAEILNVWDGLWKSSPFADVLFAALEYYVPRVRKSPSLELWEAASQWSARVDNWCHSDMLSALYSRLLAAFPGEVYPQLRTWNASEDEWLRRLSLTSLIHNTGKGAVFLPPEKVLPLVEPCVGDHRRYVQLAVGWVLRETATVYGDEVTSFLERHAPSMGTHAFARAIERRSKEERVQLRFLRTT
jgi:3-methyladenine DNA glycosylase AlkD